MPFDEVDFLVRYHIVNGAKMASANLMLKLSLPTLTGDYLTAGANVETQQRYIDNGEGKEPSFLVRKDIDVSNGVIHTLDKLLEPLTVSVWGIISGNANYSIFAGALQACGFDTWLDNTYRTINETTIRENKTVLVVSDEVFRSRGINSLDDLKAYFGGGDPADSESDFYQYVRYHLMDKLNGYAELTTFPAGYKSMTIYSCSEIKGISVLDTAVPSISTLRPARKVSALSMDGAIFLPKTAMSTKSTTWACFRRLWPITSWCGNLPIKSSSRRFRSTVLRRPRAARFRNST